MINSLEGCAIEDWYAKLECSLTNSVVHRRHEELCGLGIRCGKIKIATVRCGISETGDSFSERRFEKRCRYFDKARYSALSNRATGRDGTLG